MKTENKAMLLITNCVDCPFHKVLADPDPDDWFCDDDVKVVCTKANKNITVACRPHHIRKESAVPTWCPLAQKEKEFFATDKAQQFFSVPFIDLTKK